MKRETVYTLELFKRIDPSKKFSQFSFEELNCFEDIRSDHFCKDSIVRISDIFYIYAGEKEFTAQNSESFVRFKSGKKTVYETRGLK